MLITVVVAAIHLFKLKKEIRKQLAEDEHKLKQLQENIEKQKNSQDHY